MLMLLCCIDHISDRYFSVHKFTECSKIVFAYASCIPSTLLRVNRSSTILQGWRQFIVRDCALDIQFNASSVQPLFLVHMKS